MVYATSISSHKSPVSPSQSLFSMTLEADFEDTTPFSPSGLLQENTTDWVAYKQHKFTSHSSGGWKPKIKAPADSVSGVGVLPGSQRSIFLQGMSSQGGRRKRALWDLLYEGSNLIHEGSTLVTSSLSKVPPPNTITVGVRFRHMNLVETHSVYNTVLLDTREWVPE